MTVLAAVLREDASHTEVLRAAGKLAGAESFEVLSLYQSADSGFKEVSIQSPEHTAEAREALKKQLEADVAALSLTATVSVPHARLNNLGDDIVKWARDTGASTIVIGTHGRRGLSHFLMGSVAERVVQQAHCAVHVVRPPKSG